MFSTLWVFFCCWHNTTCIVCAVWFTWCQGVMYFKGSNSGWSLINHVGTTHLFCYLNEDGITCQHIKLYRYMSGEHGLECWTCYVFKESKWKLRFECNMSQGLYSLTPSLHLPRLPPIHLFVYTMINASIIWCLTGQTYSQLIYIIQSIMSTSDFE